MDMETFLTLHVFYFMLIFARIGSAVMIFPGVGDSFVSSRVRLLFAFGFSFVLLPTVSNFLPKQIPSGMTMLTLLGMEFLTGLFIGTVARIFMAALDVAGMVISFSSSLSNAQLFNPSLAAQGSLLGAFLSVTGTTFLLTTNMHHFLIMGVMESYKNFIVGDFIQADSMAELVSKAVGSSFRIGVQIAAPFMVLTLLIYIGMGVLSRLMPQVQVFLLALPLQILLSLVMFILIMSAGFMYWVTQFEANMVYFLG
jgi:flagellar biosynthetic protein FliR